MSGIGAVPVYNWKELFKEFSKCPADVLLKDWCEEKGLNYHNTSRHFAEYKRKVKERQRNKIEDELLRIAEAGPAKLEKLMDSEDEKIALAATNSVLDKVGFTPQVAAIQIQQNNTQNIIIPPLFAGVYQKDAERMLGGSINFGADQESSGGNEAPRLIEVNDRGTTLDSGPPADGLGVGARASAQGGETVREGENKNEREP